MSTQLLYHAIQPGFFTGICSRRSASHLNDILERSVIKHCIMQPLLQIGGAGHTVAVDESVFTKRKV